MASVETVSASEPGWLRRRFSRWIALGQYGFPFSIGRSATPVGRFRALARRSRMAGAARLPARLAMTLAWPVGALVTANRRRRLARARGRPFGLRRLADMYWLALRHNIPPLEHEVFGFEAPARRAAMQDYVYWNDLPALSALAARCGAEVRDAQDKDRFARICAGLGLAHAPTLAVFENGAQTAPTAAFIAEAPRLWVKALRLKGGAGAMQWTRVGDGYADAQGRRVPAADLTELLRGQDCIVQPVIDNHPDIARVSNGALAALRIVTGMDGDGEATLVTALMALPYGPHATSVGAIVCSIDPHTGRLRHAALGNGDPIERHPDTGAELAAIALPFWRESLALAQHAHVAGFARFPFLGWDVALSPDGPQLLEANVGWGAHFHQMLDGPIVHTAFTRLVSQYV
jgi:hypothetical protein